MKLWEGLSQELNYNVMYSPRGVMMLSHNVHDQQMLQAAYPCQPALRHRQRVADAGAGQGLLSAARYLGERALSDQRRRACSAAAARRVMMRLPGVMRVRRRTAGVHIIQNCEVTGIRRGPDGRVTGVETNRGFIGAKKVGVVCCRPHDNNHEDGRTCACRCNRARCRRWFPSR